ncbi:hypothetical protein [Actinoplanes sp. NPDC048796]|uniref:hypothetical protein n=1 Tax=Actinoplanes sp. NPDC048796 TaxID=3155640 RepID=UPI0033F0EAFA
MDELDRRLANVLTKVGERIDPATVRLRNPATEPEPGRRSRPWLVAMTSAAAVVVVVAGLTLGIRSNGGGGQPAAPAVTTQGTVDGAHPLWTLGVSETYSQTFDKLVPGGRITAPVPRTVDPELAPELAKQPTLVTGAGPVRFPGAAAVHLLERRDNGVFVAVTGAKGGDGLFDVDFVLVGAGNSRRTILHAAQAGSVAISPNGTMLAFTSGGAGEPTVKLVDVSSGRVVHQLAGRFTQAAWASDTALLLSGKSAVAWRAPWTGGGERTPVPMGQAMSVPGGMVALDDTSGCLFKLDGNATITMADCNGWKLGGQVSPDGRLVPLEWANGSTTQHGVLDLDRNQVRSWPVPGLNPSWLGPTEVLLTEDTVQDAPRTARCDVTAGTCVLAEDDSVLNGADWIGR